jgi:RNA polymerase sigma-70 factor, ECF subfamily
MDLSNSAAIPDAVVASPAREGADAFSLLAKEFYERVFQFLAHQLRDRHEAEDLTQRTFVRAFRAFGSFDQNRPFAPWIFTLARRELVDHYRRRRPDPVELEEGHFSSEGAPDGDFERRDEADQVWQLAEELPPKQRQVLLLHYAEQFSLPEVAEILGLTHVHAKVLLFRARNRLRKLWDAQKPPSGYES